MVKKLGVLWGKMIILLEFQVSRHSANIRKVVNGILGIEASMAGQIGNRSNNF